MSAPEAFEIETAVNAAQLLIGRNVVFKVEVAKQPSRDRLASQIGLGYGARLNIVRIKTAGTRRKSPDLATCPRPLRSHSLASRHGVTQTFYQFTKNGGPKSAA